MLDPSSGALKPNEIITNQVDVVPVDDYDNEMNSQPEVYIWLDVQVWVWWIEFKNEFFGTATVTLTHEFFRFEHKMINDLGILNNYCIF